MAAGSSSARSASTSDGPSDGAVRRRLGIEPDQHADACVAADQREARSPMPAAPGPPRVLGQVAGEELVAVAHHPVGRRPQRRAEVRRQARVGQHVELPVDVVGDDGPAGRGNPFLRPDATSQSATFCGIERGVGLADGLDEGVAAVDAGPERPQTALQPGGEVRPSGTASRTRARRQACWRQISPVDRRPRGRRRDMAASKAAKSFRDRIK